MNTRGPPPSGRLLIKGGNGSAAAGPSLSPGWWYRMASAGYATASPLSQAPVGEIRLEKDFRKSAEHPGGNRVRRAERQSSCSRNVGGGLVSEAPIPGSRNHLATLQACPRLQFFDLLPPPRIQPQRA